MEEKSMIESRIAELEEFLKNVEIIEGADLDTVGYGNKVTISRDGKEEVYEIVGSGEVDIFANRISLDSPLGNAIRGKKVGQKAVVDSPKGEYEVEILKIE
jgi:transcription elongation factor GreA